MRHFIDTYIIIYLYSDLLLWPLYYNVHRVSDPEQCVESP